TVLLVIVQSLLTMTGELASVWNSHARAMVDRHQTPQNNAAFCPAASVNTMERITARNTLLLARHRGKRRARGPNGRQWKTGLVLDALGNGVRNIAESRQGVPEIPHPNRARRSEAPGSRLLRRSAREVDLLQERREARLGA